MDRIDDQKLDALLRARTAPVMPDHLDAHIIAMAARTPQDGREGAKILHLSRPWFAELMQLFAIPKPACAFGAVLMAGLALGVSLGVAPVDTTVSDWTNLFSSGETWL
jgi:hypothetical protein